MKLINLQMIVSEETSTGNGKEGSPFRRLFQLWSTDGTLLLEEDSFTKKVTMTANLIELARKTPPIPSNTSQE